MAQYTNPLNEFQSHSVHYVILAARSTEDVRIFTEYSDTSMSSTLLAIDSTKQLGDQVHVPQSSTTGVYLMMDTRRFSQFTISDFGITSNMGGFSSPGSTSPFNVSQELHFTVLDSMGISFANFLQYLMDQKLQVSYQGMTLLVRVLFIGHSADGSSKIIQTIGIPAFFADLHLDLNEAKGIYTCKCVPLVGMASNSNYNMIWTSVGTASSYFTGTGSNTLGAVVKSFETRLNEVSLKRYSEYNVQIKAAGQAATDSIGRFGRPVQYMITLPASWETFNFNGPSQGGAAEVNFKELLKVEEANRTTAASKNSAAEQKKTQPNVAAPAKDGYVAVHPDMTITEILDLIFKQCVQVALLGNFTKTPSKLEGIKFYKHLVTVTSNDDSFTVHVDVIEYIVPNVILNEKPTANNTTSVGEDESLLYEEVQKDGRKIKVPKNFLEFDYIFSGKNIDVLHLDLKLERLNVLLMQGNRLGAGELLAVADNAQKQTDGKSVESDKQAAPSMLAKDPVLLPLRSGDERTNFSNLGANTQDLDGNSPQSIRQRYIQNLSIMFNSGPLKAKMTIRGNPDLFEKVTLSSIPPHVSPLTAVNGTGSATKENTDVRKAYRDQLEASLRLTPGLTQESGGAFKVGSILTGPSHAAGPVFVKVNVFGPAANFITNEISGGNFAERLFYNSYFYVFKIVSKIEGSRFTQEFELAPYSVYGYVNTTSKGQGTNNEKQV